MRKQTHSMTKKSACAIPEPSTLAMWREAGALIADAIGEGREFEKAVKRSANKRMAERQETAILQHR